MRAHRMVVLVAAVAVSLCLAACGSHSNGSIAAGASSAHAKSPIHFALITINTPGVDLLPQYEVGANAAANEINSMGGFGGRKVVIDTCNSMLQPAVATTCAHKTLADHPVAEFGCEPVWGTTGLVIYGQAEIPSFNCPNTPQDFASPWSFGLSAGSFGEDRGLARYLCNRGDVRKVVVLGQQIPQQERDVPAATRPVFKQCGVQVTYEYAPTTAVDPAPYVAKAVAAKPNFIIALPGAPQLDQMLKAFRQAGWPSTRLATQATFLDKKNVITPAGSAADGVYSVDEWYTYDDKSNPDVVAYRRALRGHNADSENYEQSYAAVMWLYTAAKRIGFANFNSASLTHFMRTQSGIRIPLSRTLVNPGPRGYAAVKQPYVLIVQWKRGQLHVVKQATQHGWVRGY